MAKNAAFQPLHFNKKNITMNSKSSNLKMTINSLFIKQLYFLFLSFFLFLSLGLFDNPFLGCGCIVRVCTMQ
jgi:hypothetical protein